MHLPLKTSARVHKLDSKNDMKKQAPLLLRFLLVNLSLCLSWSLRWEWAMKYVDVAEIKCVQEGKEQELGEQ